MAIYIILFSITLFSILLGGINSRIRFIIFILLGIILWIIAGIKGLDVGTDTSTYCDLFTASKYSAEYDRSFSGMQIIWYWFNHYLSRIIDWKTFQLICYAIIIVGFFNFFRKNSAYYFISLFLFIGLFYYETSFNIMRQYIALAIVLPGVGYVFSNKKKFILIVLIASTIHFSSLIMLLYLLFDKIKITNKIFVIASVMLAFIVGYFASGLMMRVMGVLNLSFLDSINEGISGYLDTFGGSHSPIRGLIYCTMFIISYCCATNKDSFWLKLYFVFVICFCLIGTMQQGNRMLIPFEISMLIVIPEIYATTKYRNLYMMTVLCYASAIFFYYLLNNVGEILPYSTL